MKGETTKILIQSPDPRSLNIKNCVINVGLRFCCQKYFNFGAKISNFQKHRILSDPFIKTRVNFFDPKGG